jgi:hypothetical protein
MTTSVSNNIVELPKGDSSPFAIRAKLVELAIDMCAKGGYTPNVANVIEVARAFNDFVSNPSRPIR